MLLSQKSQGHTEGHGDEASLETGGPTQELNEAAAARPTALVADLALLSAASEMRDMCSILVFDKVDKIVDYLAKSSEEMINVDGSSRIWAAKFAAFGKKCIDCARNIGTHTQLAQEARTRGPICGVVLALERKERRQGFRAETRPQYRDRQAGGIP